MIVAPDTGNEETRRRPGGRRRDPGSGGGSRDHRRRKGRNGRRGWAVLGWSLFLLVLVVAAVWWLGRQGGGEPGGEIAATDETGLDAGAGDRAVVLVFPNWDGTGFVSEERQLPSRDRLEDDLLVVMSALCAGPTSSGAVAALPEGTRALAAFYDEASGSIVLDFSQELVTNHLGGSAAENATLTTILKTIALNFPEVQQCTLLVDGAQSETLAGHLSLDQPFQPRRWL